MSETETLRELGLFAGAGGGLLASRLLGWRTVCAVELEPYCQRVLAQRQRDGHLEPFPIWDDVTTFDGRPWRGRVDVVSGGFPCQDISSAGRGAGLDGDRSSLWFSMLRIIGEVRPRYVFAENSPMLRTRGLGRVLEGLAGLGYSVAWGVLGADDVGAPHRRKRMWLAAALPDADGRRQRSLAEHAEMASAQSLSGAADNPGAGYASLQAGEAESSVSAACLHAHESAVRDASGPARRTLAGNASWEQYPNFAGVDDGVADRVERVRATGNGQVPRVAELAWRILSPLAESAARG